MKRLRKNKIARAYLIGALLFLCSAVLGILLGATDLRPAELFRAVFGGATESVEARILRYVRLPRVLASLLCGAALAVSGAVIQGVLSNRLASPSIIGVNAGAGLAVTASAACGLLGGLHVTLFAFLGAFLCAMLVSLGARVWGASRGTVILMGVALNALLGAISETITTFCPEAGLVSRDFKVGDFSAVTYVRLLPAAAIILLSLSVLLTLSTELDVLTLGEERAKGLGMNTAGMRVLFLLLAALLAGAAVSVCGLVSFVGLLVPHAVRRVASSEARHLLPLCALVGGGFVTLCDTLGRVVFAPYELPVGILMAFLGAPFFLYILVKRRGGSTHA